MPDIIWVLLSMKLNLYIIEPQNLLFSVGNYSDRVKKANAESERLAFLLNGTKESLSEKTFSQAAILSSVLLVREAELKNSRERKNELEAQLSPEFTFATKEIVELWFLRSLFSKKNLFL